MWLPQEDKLSMYDYLIYLKDMGVYTPFSSNATTDEGKKDINTY